MADPHLVGQAVATALNVREVPGQAVSQTLAGALAERRLLLRGGHAARYTATGSAMPLNRFRPRAS